MDEIDAFFNNSAEETVEVVGSQTRGMLQIDPVDFEEMYPRTESYSELGESSGTQYAEDYVRLDLEEKLERMRIPNQGMNALEDMTSIGESALLDDEEALAKIYEKYPFKIKAKPNLTINEYKSKILSQINSQNVTIIEGPTGCGKTTQVPQWILEESYTKRKHCNIIVTQPRRIAAISIAKRVCEENNFKVGSIVGHQVGLNSQLTDDTRLQYVTTGVLLQKLIVARNLNKFTHIILDEIHERNQDMDFLLIIIRKMLSTNSPSVKIVLMSATFNTEQFAEYFTMPNDLNCTIPVINITNQRIFECRIFYLDQLEQLGQLPLIEPDKPRISLEILEFTVKLIKAFSSIDEKEEEDGFPSVLIFLPGLYEIEQLYNLLKASMAKDPEGKQCNWWILPVHSTITTDEQNKVFQKPPPGLRKIILGTNIAESSITVQDVKYVIDFCLTKVVMSDLDNNFPSLHTVWASHTNCTQRAGRAGRVRSGRVYRLVTKEFYHNYLPIDCTPEMLRCPLDQLFLAAKILNMGSPKAILALAMNPPNLSQINRTIQNLKEVGALLKTVSGVIYTDDGDITYLGRIMARLPVDVRVSKLIVLGYVFGCMEECVIMGAAMSVKNIFSTPFQESFIAYNSKLTWADGCSSDCLAFINAYRVYSHLKRTNQFGNYRRGEREWAKTMFVQINALHEMDQLIRELNHRLEHEQLIPMESQKKLWSPSELNLVLKFLLAGAFYPHYFVFSRSDDEEEMAATKMLAGRDPRNTIYLTNMDSKQPGVLYTAQIKQLFQDCTKGNIVVNFNISGGGKIFITFCGEESGADQRSGQYMARASGNVSLAIYKALKLRQLKFPFVLRVMPPSSAQTYMQDLGLGDTLFQGTPPLMDSHNLWIKPILPGVDENYMYVKISHIDDCHHFWCQAIDGKSNSRVEWLEAIINHEDLAPLSGPPIEGRLYAAPFKAKENLPPRYYRVVIKKMKPQNHVFVTFIDYGNSKLVPIQQLRMFAKNTEIVFEVEALAFQCTLSEIAPSVMKDERAVWTAASVERFGQLAYDKKLQAKIYSVVFDVVSVELFLEQASVNKRLIEEGFAQPAEESFNSKLNHDQRENAEEMQPAQKLAINRKQEQELDSVLNLTTIPPPNSNRCTRTINLHGPYSPLETNLHSLFNGMQTSVRIENNSVNSILLNTEPQCHNEKLVVAAFVDQSPSGDNLMLRHTTVMPNIVGLPTLLALIFCPTAELRHDPAGTKYTTALCGLGHHKGVSLFPEHDILLNIDMDLNNDDLDNINYLRCTIDSMLITEEEQDIPMVSEEIRRRVPEIIKSTLQRILSAPKKYCDTSNIKRSWKWNYHANSEVPKLETRELFGTRAIYPVHSGFALRPMSQEEIIALSNENKKLHAMKHSTVPLPQDVVCKLCNVSMVNMVGLRLHLASHMHRERELRLLIDD